MVGQYAEPTGPVSAPKRRRRSGMALPASLAAITAVSVLISGIWVITDLNAKTSVNRRSALNALLVAEAGASHAVALMRGDLRNKSFTRLLRGSDDDPTSTTDNGLFIGHGLTSANEIPAAGRSFGGGTYWVTLTDDPAETDGDALLDAATGPGANRILARCWSLMPDGASAEIIAIIGVLPLPAIATEGQMHIGGSPIVKGQCGGLHANEVIEVSGNSVKVDGPITASETVNAGNCQIKRLDGSCNTPLNNQPPIEIPVLTMPQVCLAPVLTLNADGTITQHGTGNADLTITPADPVITHAAGSGFGGWTLNTSGGRTRWENNSLNPPDGTVCSQTDIEISGSPGDALDPWKVSIYTSKSVKVTGSPALSSFDPDGGLIIAEGDVSIAGTPGAGFNYNGMIYAGAQCELYGNAKINGQVLCKDQAQPVGSFDYVNTTNTSGEIFGSPEITFGCTGSVLSKRKIISWMQKLGT